MWLIKGTFAGKKKFDVIKMHGTTIKITHISISTSLFWMWMIPLNKVQILQG